MRRCALCAMVCTEHRRHHDFHMLTTVSKQTCRDAIWPSECMGVLQERMLMHAAQLRKKLGVVEPSREERYSKRIRNADDSLNPSPGGSNLTASLVHEWCLSASSGRGCCKQTW